MAGFFKASSSIDLVEVEELLYSRYSCVNDILRLDFLEGLELTNKAIEKELDSKIYTRWLVDYSRMDKDNFVSFNEYKEKLLGTNVDTSMSKEELLKMADDIEKNIMKEGD